MIFLASSSQIPTIHGSWLPLKSLSYSGVLDVGMKPTSVNIATSNYLLVKIMDFVAGRKGNMRMNRPRYLRCQMNITYF